MTQKPPLSSPEGDTIPFEAIVTHPTVGADPCVVPSSGEEGCGVVAEQAMLDL